MLGGAGVWHIAWDDLFIRMLASVAFGGLIGLEREWSHHPAGFRTHILVCLGSCTIMLLSIYGFAEFMDEPNVRADPARLAAQVVSGIGFLGAGAIMRNGSVVSGLTTAASIWVVAAIGLCAGAGFMYPAMFATLLAFISLLLLNKWEKLMLRSRKQADLSIQALDYPGALGRIASLLDQHDIQIVNVKVDREAKKTEELDGKRQIFLKFKLKSPEQSRLMTAIDEIQKVDFVVKTDTR